MEYFISFLEGIITFISPCLLPMLPLYMSYFTGSSEISDKKKTFINALAFVLGFTIVFMSMGAFAGSIGGFLREYQTIINVVSGGIVIIFGLSFLGFFTLTLPSISKKLTAKMDNLNIFSSILFGAIFSIGWTPCVGAFLGSALMLASQQGSATTGILMLLCYSLGLGIPFVLSALLLDQLKGTFDFIKKHYKIITTLSGSLLIIIGIAMMTGYMGKLLSMLSF